MFHNKRTGFFTFLFLIIICSRVCVFAASKTINSLSLDFTRTETILHTQQETDSPEQQQEPVFLAGKITYCKNPYLFIFQITAPQQQLMYINDQGAFLLDSDTVYDFSENADFLLQTCQDFLNWFKEDLGLSESNFIPSVTWQQDGKALSLWTCQNQEDQPLDKIEVCTDSFGRFTNLKMYMNSEILVTETKLSSFEYATGFSYPSSITSISYEDNIPIIKTELKLSKIKFNFPNESAFASKNLELTCQTPADLSQTKTIQTPVKPAQTVYRVSIPSVLVNTSYKFYKKFITNQDMTNCPFSPSCSQYMLEAVSKNGLVGFIQGLERLKRCTTTEHKSNRYITLPNGKHYDPVP